MLKDWLFSKPRTASPYTKFSVTDITENSPIDVSSSDSTLIDHLGQLLLLAHGNLDLIQEDCSMLIEDTHNLGLNMVKEYVEANILPSKKAMITRIGNFGEILASQFLADAEDYWIPIYKLRFREKKDWSMRLTDLFLVKTQKDQRPQLCYGEVKSKSGKKYDKRVARIGKEAHDSLCKDDALKNPEIIKFIRHILYESQKYEQASFFREIQQGKIQYDVRYVLFLVHEAAIWREEILELLDQHDINTALSHLDVMALRINQLRQIIDLAYESAWKGAIVTHE